MRRILCNTTNHQSEIVGQLVLVDVDPIRQRVKTAIAGFLPGYSGTTLEAYRLDHANGSAG